MFSQQLRLPVADASVLQTAQDLTEFYRSSCAQSLGKLGLLQLLVVIFLANSRPYIFCLRVYKGVSKGVSVFHRVCSRKAEYLLQNDDLLHCKLSPIMEICSTTLALDIMGFDALCEESQFVTVLGTQCWFVLTPEKSRLDVLRYLLQVMKVLNKWTPMWQWAWIVDSWS